MKKSISRKRSYADNIRKANEKNPKKEEKGSSEEEGKSKKEKICSITEEDLDKMVQQMSEDMTKAMIELNEASHYYSCTTTKDRDELECKLNAVQVKLDEANRKWTEFRSKYRAAVKREARLRNAADSNSVRLTHDIAAIQRKAYAKCNSKEKSDRRDECVKLFNELLGMDATEKEFADCRKRLLMDVMEELNVKTKLTEEEDLLFSIQFSLPDFTREAMKKFFRDRLSFDIFATTSAIRMSRKALCDTTQWKYQEFTDLVGAADGNKGRQVAFTFYNPSIESSMALTIQMLVNGSKLNLGIPYNDVLTIVLQIDKGGSLTKMGYSISNLIDRVGSPSNFTLIGLTSLGEDHANMKLAFGNVFEQMEKMNGSVMKLKKGGRDVNLRIRLKIGGDYKAICMVLGHGGASSRTHCPICEGTKVLMKNWDVKTQFPYRPSYVIGEKNISKEPFIPSLTAIDIVVPVNHVLTGVTKKVMALLRKLLGVEATEWSDEKEDRLQELTSSIGVTSGGLETIRNLKIQIMAVHGATGKLGTSSQLSPNSCHDTCLINSISEPHMNWNLIECSSCGKSNHGVCARVWSGDWLGLHNLKEFKCLDCRGETAATLMRFDMECVEDLEVAETEMMESMAMDEGERKELIRDEGRTNDKLTAALDQMKVECGVYHRHYYADLIGEDARRLTRHENAVKLWNLIENEETRAFGIQLFDSIHDLFKTLHTGYQTSTEIGQFDTTIERIQQLWTRLNPTETVPLKLHSLIHISEAMKREGHGGREVELIEHAHHSLNQILPKYVTVTPLHRRLSIVVNRFNGKRFLLF